MWAYWIIIYRVLSKINLCCSVCCGQTVEKQPGAGVSSFAVSSLEMGKTYIVTIIAYRGNKRSKVVETIFKTGLCFSHYCPPQYVNEPLFPVLTCHFPLLITLL